MQDVLTRPEKGPVMGGFEVPIVEQSVFAGPPEYCDEGIIRCSSDYNQGVSTPRTVTGQLETELGGDGVTDRSTVMPKCATVEFGGDPDRRDEE